MTTLKAKTNQAYQRCAEYEIATGMVYKATVGNLGAIGLGMAHSIVSTLLPPPLAPIASLAFGFAEDHVKQSDRNRSDDLVNRLNLQYAEISQEGQLRELWKPPMQAKLGLLDVTLSYLSEQETDSNKKAALLEESALVRAGNLKDLDPNSRAFALLHDPIAFRTAARTALVGRNLVPDIGAGIAGSIFSKVTSARDATTVDTALHEGAIAALSAVAEDHKAPSEAGPTGANPEVTTSESETLWSKTAALRKHVTDLAGGMQTFTESIVKGVHNLEMGMSNLSTYRELLVAYQTAAAFIKEAEGTPPSPQNVEVERDS
jgi:hypothetical protein